MLNVEEQSVQAVTLKQSKMLLMPGVLSANTKKQNLLFMEWTEKYSRQIVMGTIHILRRDDKTILVNIFKMDLLTNYFCGGIIQNNTSVEV